MAANFSIVTDLVDQGRDEDGEIIVGLAVFAQRTFEDGHRDRAFLGIRSGGVEAAECEFEGCLRPGVILDAEWYASRAAYGSDAWVREDWEAEQMEFEAAA